MPARRQAGLNSAMPRSYVIGNGNVLISFDRRAQARDWFYPYAGMDAHLTGERHHRLGLFVNNRLTWLSDPAWQLATRYERDSLVVTTEAREASLGLKLEIADTVYNEKDVYLRRVRIFNNRDAEQRVKLFFSQDFVIYSIPSGNTAYYDPFEKAIIHYKGRRVFLVAGRLADESFQQYTVGFANFKGKEGTWRDAEDGTLAGNAIEHGSVDSTIGFALTIKARSYKTVYYWVAMAETVEDAQKLNHYVLGKTPQHLVQSTTDFWRAWVNKQNFNFFNLPPEVVELFKRSLLIIRTHVDNRGGILASADSNMLQGGQDAYAYVWPRDAAYTVLALDKAGYFDLTKKFFNFIRGVIREEGYLMHKYRPDGSLGSSWHPWVIQGRPHLPIQEDETASVLYALWRHYLVRRDIDYIEDIFNSFIVRMADFLVRYRDPVTKLPLPSYDLWEEKLGVSTYACSTVFGALMAAFHFSRILGKHKLARHYEGAANEIQEAIIRRLFNKERGAFYKMLRLENEQLVPDPTLDASSLFGVLEYQVLHPEDDLVQSTIKAFEGAIWHRAPVGGAARYESDQFFRADPATPNPWFITTLWLAHYYIHKAKSLDDMQPVLKIFRWVVEHATPEGLLAEQIQAHTGEALSVTPLIWSHAEFVRAVLEYLEKLDELGVCRSCSPLILRFR